MSEPRSWGRVVVGTLVIAVICALLFLVPSAWLIHQGQSRWLALAAGLAAFPVVPGLWQLLAERRRKQRGVKGTLTAGDRFVMRLIAVALVAIAPLLVFSRGQTWTALKEQPTWFLHWGGGDADGGGGGGSAGAGIAGAPVTGDARLPGYVPDDAEAVVWMRATKEFLESMTRQFGGQVKQEPDPDVAQELLVALRRDAFLLIIRARKAPEQDELGKLERELGTRLFGGQTIGLVLRSPQPDLHLIVTQTWDAAVRERAAGTRPAPGELLALLDGAPADALVVAAARNAAVGGVIVERGTGNLRIADEQLRIETDLQLATATAAGALRGALSGYLDDGKRDAPESCREPVDRLVGGIDIGGDGTAVAIRAKLSFEALLSAMFCRMGTGGDGGDQEE